MGLADKNKDFLLYKKYTIDNTFYIVVDPWSLFQTSCPTPTYTVLFCTLLYCTVWYCTVLSGTVLYCNIMYFTVLNCYLYCLVGMSSPAMSTRLPNWPLWWFFRKLKTGTTPVLSNFNLVGGGEGAQWHIQKEA